jgi:hypothetical protein
LAFAGGDENPADRERHGDRGGGAGARELAFVPSVLSTLGRCG